MSLPLQRAFLSSSKLFTQLCFRALSCSGISKSNIHADAVNAVPDVEHKLLPYRNAVHEQGNLVRKLKDGNASKDVLSKAIADLKAKKHLLEAKELELCPPIEKVDKAKLDDLIKQRFFYDQSFDIYGGVQGLYDFGPMGCALKANLLQEWRNFFVLADHMLEVDCPVLTPEPVLKASGHVDRFTDYLVSDSATGESYRADHLVRRWLEDLLARPATPADRSREAREALGSVDSVDGEGLQRLIDSFGIKSPGTGNQLTRPRPFNLMLETTVGSPAAPHRLYLRPETAQGIFVNFRRLLEANRGRLPMAVAQIGSSFRNEIAPRSGLLRLREFTLAEIEHFYDPADARHPGFASVAGLSLPLLSAADQAAGRELATWRRLDSAVASAGGPIAQETLAYYLGRVHLFLTGRCGIDPRRLRFRQHPPGEMAHYASDCWDAECRLAPGVWVECVGCADRAAYDLARHAAASGVRLTADRQPGSPSAVEAVNNTGMREAPVVPCVVEPSFGVGRVVAAALEHSFRVRRGPGAGRTYLSLPARLAPYKCVLLPMSGAAPPAMSGLVARLSADLTRAGLWHSVDATPGASIGKRYARNDQIGVPYAVTVDFDSVAAAAAGAEPPGGQCQPTVTLRERDSMRQVRVEVDKIPDLIQQLVHERITWQQVMEAYPVFHQQIATRE